MMSVATVLLLLVPPSAAAAVPPAPFSWDVVPTYSFPCYAPNDRQVGGPFTPADIELLLKFPVVVLCHGYFDTARALVRAEPAMRAVARQLKARKPTIRILFYYQTVLDWEDTEFHEQLAARPELWARRADGRPTCTTCAWCGPGTIGTACDATAKGWCENTTYNGKTTGPLGCMLSPDLTNPAARALVNEQCLNATRTGLFDGCFADRADSLPGQNGASTPTDLDPAKVAAFEREPQATRGLFGCVLLTESCERFGCVCVLHSHRAWQGATGKGCWRRRRRSRGLPTATNCCWSRTTTMSTSTA